MQKSLLLFVAVAIVHHLANLGNIPDLLDCIWVDTSTSFLMTLEVKCCHRFVCVKFTCCCLILRSTLDLCLGSGKKPER